MNSWTKFSLDQVAEVLDSFRVPVNSEKRASNPGNTPYYGANGLQGYISGWLFDEPLILIAEDGGCFNEYTTRPVAYRIEGKSWVNNHAHVLRPREGFEFNYIFYCLQHINIIPFIKGGTRAKLNQKELREIKIYAPLSFSLQQKISSILQTIDQTIEKTEALIEKYQLIKAGLMHDLFTRGIGADGKLRPPREEAPELYQETPIGWIPKEWALTTVEHVGGYVTSGSRDWAKFYSEEGSAFVRIGNLTREHINLRLEKLMHVQPPANSDGQRTRLETGDILVSITADLGIIGVIPDRFASAYINQHIALIRFENKEVNPRFIGNYLSSSSFQRFIEKLNDSGAKAGLNLPSIRTLPIILLNIKEQDMIATRIDTIDDIVELEKDIYRKLVQQKSGLMHDLLTGKVPVTVKSEPQPEPSHV
ncbi:MAG: restriction endonuclease subunit S [Desulforhopalus sp.]|nr:restriction endonuclease subunit S [Desulforhopalus sp.]